MEQGSNLIEEEAPGMMTIQEAARMNEILSDMGLTSDQIIIVQQYIATGTGWSKKEQSDVKESD